MKICGITEPFGLEAAVEAGADAVGFVMAASERRVEPKRAAELARDLPPFVSAVAVFRYPTVPELRSMAARFTPHLVQAEPGRDVLKEVPLGRLLPVFHDSDSLAVRVANYFEVHPNARSMLLEGPGRGGRGVRPDWTRASRIATQGRLILAGGLTPDNVGEAIRAVRPYGVDVSSGVEASKGVKDPVLIHAFVEAVRDAERSLGTGDRGSGPEGFSALRRARAPLHEDAFGEAERAEPGSDSHGGDSRA